MNALAHYSLLLAKAPSVTAAESTHLKREARELYERLQISDGDRKGRYMDMGESSSLAVAIPQANAAAQTI